MGANFIKKAGVYPDKGGKLNPLDDITRRSLKDTKASAKKYVEKKTWEKGKAAFEKYIRQGYSPELATKRSGWGNKPKKKKGGPAEPFSTLHRKSARAKALEKMPKQKKRKEYTSRLSAKGGNFPGGYMGGKGFLLPAGPGGKRRRVTEAEFKKMRRKMKPIMKFNPKKKKK